MSTVVVHEYARAVSMVVFLFESCLLRLVLPSNRRITVHDVGMVCVGS